MANISCRQLHKSYDQKTPVLQPFDLEIADGEFIVLLGPSGCGKSTLLRMIAGLEDISGGELLIGDSVVNDLPSRERNVAMVFQNYALYPHMTVYDNIAFGLRRLKVPAAEIDRRVHEVADILSLGGLLERKPRAMSGGQQQQRTAIARAMIKTPQVFLFDEPLSNLDAKLRAQLRADIKRLHRRLRPNHVRIAARDGEPGALGLSCVVELVELLGAEALISFQCAALALAALVPAHAADSAVQAGAPLNLAFDEEHIHLFDAESGLALGLV